MKKEEFFNDAFKAQNVFLLLINSLFAVPGMRVRGLGDEQRVQALPEAPRL